MEYLYVITFLNGVLTVLFDLAYQSYLPSLAEREKLVEGNSKLQISVWIAQIGGPGLGGVLISLLTAPIAILLDALTSYLVSAFSLTLIRKDEPMYKAASKSILSEVGSGLRLVFTNPYLRAIACEAAAYNLFSQVS